MIRLVIERFNELKRVESELLQIYTIRPYRILSSGWQPASDDTDSRAGAGVGNNNIQLRVRQDGGSHWVSRVSDKVVLTDLDFLLNFCSLKTKEVIKYFLTKNIFPTALS